MNVLFAHTYVGLGKSTFLELLQKKYPSFYEIVSSDKINKEMREANPRVSPMEIGEKFALKIKYSKKIVLADKNFPSLKDVKNLTKFTGRSSTILFAKDSFELPSILLLLNRVLKRTDHETISSDDEIQTMRIMLNFVQKSKASSQGKPPKVPHIEVNFFKNNISTADISIFEKALIDTIKVAGFTSESKGENKDYLPKLINLHRLIKKNQAILDFLSKTHLKTLSELDAEIISVHTKILAVAKAAKPKVASKSPLYIGYFIENNSLIKKLSTIKALTDEVAREGSDFVIAKVPTDETTSHITMAFGESNVKLFVMSQPPTTLQFKINGLLRVIDKKGNKQEVLDVETVGVSPVKVSKMVNPFHITFKTKKGLARFSGDYLQKFRQKSLSLKHQYIPITTDERINLDLRVFYSKGRGVPGEIEKITAILPDDTLSIFNTRNAEKDRLLKLKQEMINDFSQVNTASDVEINRIIDKYGFDKRGNSAKKRSRIRIMSEGVVGKINKELKKISGNYSIKDEPNPALFEPVLTTNLSTGDKAFIMKLLDSGFTKFMSSQDSASEEMFNILLERAKLEINTIKLMSPNNFRFWSTAYFNWLSGLSNAGKDGLVKKNIEYSKDGESSQDGFGFKTQGQLDDKIYKENEELRRYLPRGIYFDSDKQLKNFAIRKFFGEGLDEDFDEGEIRDEGKDKFKNLFKTKPTHFFATEKANGENGQIHADNTHIFIGSKNRKVKLRIARWKTDLLQYKTNFRKVTSGIENYGLYSYSLLFAENLLTQLTTDGTFNNFIKFLQLTKWTGNFEYEDINSQHIVYLPRNRSVLIGFSSPFMDGLTCHPFLSVLIGISCNIPVVGEKGTVRDIREMKSYINKMRQERNSEGDVIVELDKDGRALSLVKKKTYWYIILRATREKIRSILSKISNGSITNLETAKKEVVEQVNLRLTKLFNEPFLKNVSNREERRNEMFRFSEFVVEKYFKLTTKSNVRLFLGQYPVFYNDFSRIYSSRSATTEKKYNYQSKYLKYKQKYLTLKKLLGN